MARKLIPLLLFSLLLCLPVLGSASTVTTSFFPIHLFASNLLNGIDEITLHSLAQPDTGCLHDYQLSSGDLIALSDSDVFLINGADMESFMDFVFDAFPEMPVVNASEGIALLPSVSGETEYNAHIWLTPANAQQMCRNLADGLIRIFPQYEDRIQANLASYVDSLEALDETLKVGLASLTRRDIVTFHEAFPYFADYYDLSVVAVIALEPDDALSTGELAALVTTIRENNLPPLFTEPQYPSLAADVLARETGAPVYTLDPVVTPPSGELPLDWYQTVMLENLKVLQSALGSDLE
ncbi:MAG: zinc ABC transporter substrate-binding protein [Clostridia bacterium]|nr:zinc ABC transporter substrate-binding protein [Clostridia bacterium]MBR2286638.1 zinc ABC transporter substrate-binding protein [Clostridia bacterium]